MKVRSIRPAGTADVYNMEVADTHDFAVGPGVIVHNCYDMVRYVCMSNPVAAPVTPQYTPKEFDPLESEQQAREIDRYAWYRSY